MIRSKLVCFLIVGSTCFAQDIAPNFEVVSVKLDRFAAQPRVPGTPSRQVGPECRGGRFIATANTMGRVIGWAYGILGVNITGYPGWALVGSPDAWYDIEATAGRPVELAQCKLMARALLADRFHLVVRLETKELPVFALVLGKNGPRNLREVRDPSEARRTGAINGRGITPDTGRVEPWSMQQLALALNLTTNRVSNRQVVDKTGLPGVYEFNLRYDEFEGLPNIPHDLPDLRTALQQQLGLNLEERKEPIDTLVIVRLDKPSGNE
jgi:uncharacterized protein (TIGR03435 family)